MHLDKRELATVLAALRYWQREGWFSSGHEVAIASDDGNIEQLTPAEIDDLCETICANVIPTAVVEINGGAVHCARSSQPMRIIILDEDIEGADSECVRDVNGDANYVHDFMLAELTTPGQNGGVDQPFVASVVEQI